MDCFVDGNSVLNNHQVLGLKNDRALGEISYCYDVYFCLSIKTMWEPCL